MAMRMFRWMILAGAMILAAAPATAQTYNNGGPICLQKWQWGGSYYYECSYASWDQCRASAVGLAAMCVANPYWQQARPRSSGRILR
jgi:hypothetical protein